MGSSLVESTYYLSVALPYPIPTSAAVSAVMRANRKRDTGPELALRSALHRRGMRFRACLPVVAAGVRVVPDIVFPRRRIALFLDGCWWHRCPAHANAPKANTDYWGPKLARNVERDRLVDAALSREGWLVIRVWEHEDAAAAADRVAAAVDGRRVASGS
jgi:DNA mismatch endonuclease (patch repair protein)